jgi:hypothetical protein
MYGRGYAAPILCQPGKDKLIRASTLGQSLEIVPDGEKAAPSLLGACFLTQKDWVVVAAG